MYGTNVMYAELYDHRAIHVSRNTMGCEGLYESAQISTTKVHSPTLLASRGRGRMSNLQKKTLRNTLMAPYRMEMQLEEIHCGQIGFSNFCIAEPNTNNRQPDVVLDFFTCNKSTSSDETMYSVFSRTAALR